jgi:hypothetical protein
LIEREVILEELIAKTVRAEKVVEVFWFVGHRGGKPPGLKGLNGLNRFEAIQAFSAFEAIMEPLTILDKPAEYC